MDLIRSKFSVFALAFALMAVASGQTQDSSGDSMLKGTYAFRHVAVQNVDSNFNPLETTASYGTITFDGNGNYTVSGTTVDNTVNGGSPQTLSVAGTYAIGSNGAGYVSNPLYPTDFNVYMYGAVSQGVFTGSSTESEGESAILNDVFVAIPLGVTPTNATFTASYQTGLIDFENGDSSAIKNALFELIPNGKGAFSTIQLTGQASNNSQAVVNQTVSGATYSFSGGSATLNIPVPTGASSDTALFSGTKTMYVSSDGNFVLGYTTSGYDVFFGVKALASSATNSTSAGLYFTAALEDGFNGVDSFYGGTSNSGDSNGDGVVHERLNVPGSSGGFDYGSDDQIMVNSNGSTQIDLNGYQYLFGDGGQAFVAIGTQGYYSLIIGMHAASFSGPGVYLNPVGIANAASYQPVTASLAPGELIVLFGTGLASGSATAQGGQAFPTNLGGVTVTIDNIPCPIYYVTATQMSVIVPYEVASNQTGLANIQITNNGVKSNVVQMYLTDASPGAFSQNQNGIGFAAALHATTGVEITTASPAQPGEYISLYLTGLGPVTPGIADGALGPATTLSNADVNEAGNLSVNFNDYNSGSTGNPGTILFAGLAPTLAGLYQINVQVPKTGLTAGDDVYVEFITDAADVNQIQIPYGASGVLAVPVKKGRLLRDAAIKAHRNNPKTRLMRRRG